MTAIGIIPARYASTRLPGKVIMPIKGYPMIHHVYHQAKQSDSLSEVLVATDSVLVGDSCSRHGLEFVLTDEKHKSGTDRIAEAARGLDHEAQIIVNIQGDEPQLDPAIIDNLVVMMEAHPEINMGSVGSTVLSEDDLLQPSVVKVLVADGKAVNFYRLLPDAVPPGKIMRHVGIYAYRTEFLQTFASTPPSKSELEHKLEQLRAIDMGETIGMVSCDYKAVAVDTREDWEKVQSNWTEPEGRPDE